MNHVYRVVWNRAQGLWQVVSENARWRGSSRLANGSGHGTLLLLVCMGFGPVPVEALPSGGVVTAGAAAIDRGANQLTIEQAGDRVAIDWQRFSIGRGERVRFLQPSSTSVALNRVVGSDVSVIQGALEANGQVFLVNPNGVLFTASAQVDVGGLVASTLDLSLDGDGRYHFEGDSAAAVVNRGRITAADGGTLALVAARVENAGTLAAPGGNVLMGAGRSLTLDLGGPVKLQVDEGAVAALVENRGAVYADGGTILLTARAAEDLAGTVINNSGLLEARSLAAGQDGSVVLLGERGEVAVSGALDVSSAEGEGGLAVVSGTRVNLSDTARIDASGRAGGGRIFVGGGWRGRDTSIANANSTAVAAGARLDASARQRGEGGTVVVWADGDTRFAGSIAAGGGAGGRVEVSGKHTLAFTGSVDSGGGMLLLDPEAITIQSGDGDSINTFSGAQLALLLAGNDVQLEADDTITWNSAAALDYAGVAADRKLTLSAGGSITFNGEIGSSVATDALSVTLEAGNRIDIAGRIDAGQGGDILLEAEGQVRLAGGEVLTAGLGTLQVLGNTGLELNTGHLQVADGDLLVEVNNNINPIWGGSIDATGHGNIQLTSRSGGIYLGGSGSSAGHVTAQNGDISLTADLIEIRANSSSVSGGGKLLLQPYTQTASIGIGDGAAGTLSLLSQTLQRLTDGFSRITIGREDGSGDIAVGNASFRDDVLIRAARDGAAIVLGGNLSAPGAALALQADGGISQSATARIEAASLALSGAGDVALAASAHNVGTLAAALTGALSFRNGGALSVGQAGGLEGVDAGGPVQLSTDSGDLVVGRAIVTGDASDSAIVLNAGAGQDAGTAGGGDIRLAAGLTFGTGGRATLYTGSLAGSTGVAGAGSGHFRYGSDEVDSAYSAALGNGLYVIYRERPTLSVTPGAVASQYGDTPSLDGLEYTVSGYRNGDSGSLSGSADFSTDACATCNAGIYDIAYDGGLASSLGYAVADATASSGEYRIDPRVLNLSGSRTYDGTTGVAAGALALANLANGDSLILSGSGQMADRNAGDGKSFTLGTLALANGADGDLASNYTLVGGSRSVDIDKALLQVSTSDVVREYDGTTDAAGAVVVVAGTLFGGDTLSGGSFAFDDADAGTDKHVSVSGVTLADGNGGGNYDLSYVDNTHSRIDPRTLTLSGGFAVDSKTYDGNTLASISDGSGLLLSGLVAGESLGLDGLEARFADADAGDGKSVSLVAGSLVDAAGKASNYRLVVDDAPTAQADIGRRTLTLSGMLAASDKVYDGGANATLDISGLTLDGLVAGEDLDLSDLAGLFEQADAGRDIRVRIDAASLADGAHGRAANYRLEVAGAPEAQASILRRELWVTADDQIKAFGRVDPVLGYRVEMQSGDRGLVAGESLSGALARDAGEMSARYAIGQGTLDDLNNPNYRIAFTEGAMTITPAPPVATALQGGQQLSGTLSRSATTGAAAQANPDDGLYYVASGDTPASVDQAAGAVPVVVIQGGIRLPTLQGD